MPPLTLSLLFPRLMWIKFSKREHPYHCQADLSNMSGELQECATVQNNVACCFVLYKHVLPSTQILDGTLPGSRCGVHVC